MRHARQYLFFILLGCSPDKMSQTSDGSIGDSTTQITSTSSSVSDTSATSSDTSTTSTSSSTHTVVSASSSSETSSIIELPDMYSEPLECDVWNQGCPRGQKCTPYSMHWDKLMCVPLAEDLVPIGAPCNVLGEPFEGLDDCPRGAICWDAVDETGVCIALCSGSFEQPTCPLQKTACDLNEGLVLNLCIETCDPLLQDCPQTETCVPGLINYFCKPDFSDTGGQPFTPCDHSDQCKPGNICTSADDAVECSQEDLRCCVPYCDVGLPNDCPGNGQECEPYYEPGLAPSGLEHVGVCSLP